MTHSDPALEFATELPALRLRAWRATDRDALRHHADDRAVWINLTDRFPHPYTQADADDWIAFACAPRDDLIFAIEHAGEAIGGAGVYAGVGNAYHTGQFGYWLGRAHWGRGFATAAARALRRRAFEHARFERLEAPVFAWNPASMRVLEKSGFVREGVLRRSVLKAGKLIDSVMYGALRDG